MDSKALAAGGVVLLLVSLLFVSYPRHPADVAVSDRFSCPGCNVLLISVETTRADHLGCYGYPRKTTPFIDSLAAEGVLFENAFAVRAETWPSLTSMLTALYPPTSNVRDNGELLDPGATTLEGELGRRGYLTAAYLSHFCEAGAYGFNESFCAPYTEEGVGGGWLNSTGYNDDLLTKEAMKWLGQNNQSRFFLWMHYFAPHSPYHPPEKFDIFTDKGYGGRFGGGREDLDVVALNQVELSPSELDHIVSLYDGEILFADTLIGRVVGRLRMLGLENDTIIIVTADHGEDLYQHSRYFYHGCSIRESSLRIPLIILLPSGAGAGRRVAAPVENIDIAPTILEALNISRPVSFEGKSLMPLIREREKVAGFDAALGEWYANEPVSVGMYSIRTGRWHYIYNPANITPWCNPRGDYYRVAGDELYDISEDPYEAHNLAAERPDIAKSLREEMLKRYPREAANRQPITAGEGNLETLRSLGYLA